MTFRLGTATKRPLFRAPDTEPDGSLSAKPFSQQRNRLEEDYAQPYYAWQATPNPQTAGALLTSLQPVIDKGISLHIGKGASPLMTSRARRMVLDALPKYDPQTASLGTYLTSQLQGLKRINAQQNRILAMPERVALDRVFLDDAERELEDTLARPATLAELANHTGLSIKRIRHVRSFHPGIAEGQLEQAVPEDEEGSFEPAVQQPSTLWQSIVYEDLAPIDKTIMEYSLGLGGRKRLNNQQLAAKLRVSPGYVSQRKAGIQALLDREEEVQL